MRQPVKSGSCIYKLYNQDVIVYIGQSSNSAYCRIGKHLEDKVFDSFEIINCDINLLNEVEAELIIINNPKYNTIVPSNNKWISKNTAKNKFNISKYKFNKLLSCGYFTVSYSFNGCIYVLKNELLEVLKNGN